MHNCFCLQQCINNRTGYTPLPFKSGVSLPKTQSKVQKVTKAKAKPAKQTPLHNKNVISSIIAEKAKLSQEMKLEKHGSKVKPKLKAEVKVKNWEDDENDTVPSENVPPEEPVIQKLVEVAKSLLRFIVETDRLKKFEFKRNIFYKVLNS